MSEILLRAGQVVEKVVERLFAPKIAQVIVDAVPTRDESTNLLDRDYQLDLFQWREGHMVASVANRFRRGLNEGYDAFEVFRAVQDHAVNAARAHMDRVALEAFVAAIDQCEDESLRDALKRPMLVGQAMTEKDLAQREITIMADKALPYEVLKKVMSTCTDADYGKVSLAVIQKEKPVAPGAFRPG